MQLNRLYPEYDRVFGYNSENTSDTVFGSLESKQPRKDRNSGIRSAEINIHENPLALILPA